MHPAAERDTYRALFERRVTAGGSRRRLPDGSQIHAVTADGTRVPVEISAETVELGDRTVVFGVFRDVSDQLEYERALTELNEATVDLFTAETPAVVAERVVETVRAVIEPAAAKVYLADETEGVLRQAAHAAGPDLAANAGGQAIVQPGDHVAWRAFA
ncbi:PAS domain S-box protein, partial [Halobacterium bonnevillei]|uniref:PAS domain S-box protein n=1 Tax=Halobacterium bonnevillei TaxID=2692200 RepID=UPI001F270B3B